MLKRFSFLLILITIIYNGYSQNVTVGTMIRHTMKEAWGDVEPIGHDNQGVYYLMLPYSEVIAGPVLGPKIYYVAQVNDKAEITKKETVTFEVDGVSADYEFTREMDGKTLFFTSIENKKSRSVTFYVHELDRKELKLVNPRKIFDLSFADIKREYEKARFKAEISRDKSKMLISYSLLDKENSILGFGYVVLDKNQKQTVKWSGSLDMSDGVYLFDQFRISNKGEVYLLTRYFKNNKDLDKNVSMKKTNVLSTTRTMRVEDNYEHRVVKFETEGKSRIFPVVSGNRFFTAMDADFMSDGNLILIGFYSTDGGTLPGGAACLKLNTATGAINESGSKEFGDAYRMPSDISIKNNGLVAGDDQYLNYRFVLSDIHYNKNGGYTLIGERTVTQTKRNGNYFYTVYHTDDLAVVDVSANGEVKNVHRIEKSQQTSDFLVFNSSYFFAEHNNNKYFAFANIGKSNTTESVLVKIAADGTQSRQVLFGTKETEVTIRPGDCELLNGNTMLMYARKNNRYVRWVAATLD